MVRKVTKEHAFRNNHLTTSASFGIHEFFLILVLPFSLAEILFRTRGSPFMQFIFVKSLVEIYAQMRIFRQKKIVIFVL